MNRLPNKQPESLSILFADDEPSLQELMRLELPQMGHRVTVCPDGFTAVAVLEKERFDCLLVDLDMPGMNGIQVIARAHTIAPETEAIVLTGKQTMESAIEALRYGVVDYLSKPCRLADLEKLLSRVAARRDLRRQYVNLQRQSSNAKHAAGLLIGEHVSMKTIQKLISKVAPTNSTVLIRGETGCGKELVAQALHNQSSRKEQPFVAINCGALPENLIESELFGHCKGAFTGAETLRKGLFEIADKGTIFLDEIGELPTSMQAKLLRVLESGDVRRVGDNQPFKVDVRVICATHRDLDSMIEAKIFREDLLFRINPFEIHVPPLRERSDDIESLVKHLYLRFRPEHASLPVIFAPETLGLLKAHRWPGNVRELANVIEHATILCDFPPIEPEHLPRHFADRKAQKAINRETVSQTTLNAKTTAGNSAPKSLKELELVSIHEAVTRHGGNKHAAAEELGISLKTLYNKLAILEVAKRAA